MVSLYHMLSGRHGSMSGLVSLECTVRSWMRRATSCPVPEGSWCWLHADAGSLPGANDKGGELKGQDTTLHPIMVI